MKFLCFLIQNAAFGVFFSLKKLIPPSKIKSHFNFCVESNHSKFDQIIERIVKIYDIKYIYYRNIIR